VSMRLVVRDVVGVVGIHDVKRNNNRALCLLCKFSPIFSINIFVFPRENVVGNC